jgi:hypothetical protein
MKKLIVLIALSLLLAGCGEAVSSPAAPDTQTPSAQLVTPTPQETVQPTATAQPTAKPATPTPQPVDSYATMPHIPGLGSEGGPELGSPMSVFVNTFGKPYHSSDPVSGYLWAINNDHITLSAASSLSGSNKIAIILILPDTTQTWSKDRTSMVAFCSEFLPYDAVAVNHTVDPEFDRTKFTSNYAGAFTLLVNKGTGGVWNCSIDTGN